MYSLNRVFFLTLGIVCLALIPLFLGASFFDYIALENFIVRLATTKLVGYPFPELLGAEKGEPLQLQVALLKKIFIGILSFYGILFIFLSYLPTPSWRWKGLFLFIGFPFFISLFGFWFKFNNDDHVIGVHEKEQLFHFTLFLLLGSLICFYYGTKKPRVKKRRLEPKIRSSSKKEESSKGPVETGVVTVSSKTDSQGDETEENLQASKKENLEGQIISEASESQEIGDDKQLDEEQLTDSEREENEMDEVGEKPSNDIGFEPPDTEESQTEDHAETLTTEGTDLLEDGVEGGESPEVSEKVDQNEDPINSIVSEEINRDSNLEENPNSEEVLSEDAVDNPNKTDPEASSENPVEKSTDDKTS